MFMLWLYRYITGYVKFEAIGGFSERFLNLCAINGITVWGSSLKDETLIGFMQVRDYKKIRKIAKKAQVRLKVQKRYGAVFIIHRYRKRTGLAVGFLLFFAILWFLSSFIWNINIVGNKNISSQVILQKLKSVGVYEGRWRGSINAEESRLSLLMEMPELSWAAVNMRGTLATVDVRETVKPPEKTTADFPCNIVAAADGRIVSIKCYEGTKEVQVGEAVTKGDLLISGTVELKNSMTLFKHAKADVYAETVRELNCFIPFEQTDRVSVRSPKKRSVLTLFSVDIPLFLGSVDEPYDAKKTVWNPEINGVRLPLCVTTATFQLKKEVKFNITQAVAVDMAKKQIDEMCKQQLSPILIKKLEQTCSVQPNGVYITQKFLCKENIAKDENILINK